METRRNTVLALAILLLLLCGCKRKQEGCDTAELRFDNLIGMTQARLQEAEIRESLWSHWRTRKCGKLLTKWISKEGKETDVLYEVKLLPASTLVMVITTNRASYGYQGQVFWHEVSKDDVYSVERIRPDNSCSLNTNSKVEVLPENVILSGAEYCLRFRGWGNEVVSVF